MKSSSDLKFDNEELEKLKDKYCSTNEKDSEQFEDVVIDCIENNGDPKIVLKSMLLQRERDQIMIAQEKLLRE